jgi:glutaminase
MQGLQALLDDIWADLNTRKQRGKIASYIPELAKVDPKKFGFAVTTLDGETFSVGNDWEPFSIQSISKIFVLTLALNKLGSALWERVGREPSGSAFNSIVQLEYEKGIPRNPFINAGAIVATDVVLADLKPRDAIDKILELVRLLANDNSIEIDISVAKSEADIGFRNAALANYMRAYNNLNHPFDQTLDVYFHQCAIAMNCRQLAQAGLYLANRGRNPVTKEVIISSRRARRINALMLTCGHYDGSGDFAFRVGLPGKSGVGGGVLAIVPEKASIAVWSPGLNANGNSLLGTIALERLAQGAGWNVFGK